jgi:hypothetical protein
MKFLWIQQTVSAINIGLNSSEACFHLVLETLSDLPIFVILFQEASSISDYTASKSRAIGEKWIGKDLEGSGRANQESFLEELRESVVTLSRGSRRPDEIRKQHHPNTSLEPYHQINLFSVLYLKS